MKRSKDTFKLNYQYRIVPNKQQLSQLNEWLSKLCHIHNLMLSERFKWWECNRSPVNACPILVTHLQISDGAGSLAIYPRDETERGKRSEFIRQSNNPDDTQPIV